MQAVEVSEQRSRWQRWGRMVFLGLLLALFQMALLWIDALADSIWWAALAGGIFFYLLIPGVEAFITTHNYRDPQLAIKRACLVGLVNYLILCIAALVYCLILLFWPLTVCPCEDGVGLMLWALGYGVVFEALGSFGVGAVGGA